MKACVVKDSWGTENIRLTTRPDPIPETGEALIRIQAISINPRDLVMVQGGYGRIGGAIPMIPLCDGAGVIEGFGPDTDQGEFDTGMMVCPTYSRTWLSGLSSAQAYKGAHGGPVDGTACELFTVPVEALVKAPSHMTAAEAATLPCAAVTAWNALHDQGKIGIGDTVLLQGTGGVSLFCLQIAKILGANVIMTSSSDEKLEKVKALGADHIINYRKDENWHRTVMGITEGKGVDHVVDVGGASTLDKATACIRHSGSISLIGVLGGGQAELGLGRVVTRNLRLQGVTVGSRESFAAMAQAFDDHKVKPVLDHEPFDFGDLGKALQDQTRGVHFGKKTCILG